MFRALLGFTFFFGIVYGTIIDKVLNTNTPYIAASTQGFGFLRDGTLEVSLEKDIKNGAGQWFLFCTLNEITTLFNFNVDACIAVNNSTCTLSVPFTDSLTISQFIVPAYGVYYTEILNCQKVQFQATLHMVFLNPGQDHLSYGYMPYPSLFIILSFIWGFTILVWCFNWIRFRSQPSRLNRLMTVLPIIKFIYCGIGILYWKTESVIGEVPNNIEYTFIFFIILEEAIFFLILMTIASGWGVSKDHFGSEKFIILGIIVALMGTRILGYFIHQLFFLLSFLAGLIIVVLIFRFVNLNLRALQLQMRENPTPITNDGTLRNPMAEKTKN